jgi:hypothetical protein
MSFRKAREREHVSLGVVRDGGAFAELGAPLIGHGAPSPDDRFLRILSQGGVDNRQHHVEPSVFHARA